MSFPDDDCVPTEAAQLDAFFDVALFVAFYFLFPEWGVALGHYKVFATLVAVPEAAVDEDDCPVLAQYYVGGTRQAFDIYAVAVAVGMKITAHNQTPSPQSASRQLPSGSGAVVCARVGYGCNATGIDSMGEPQRGYNHHTERKKEEYKEVISLLKRGYSVRNTAKLSSVSVSTVQRVKREFSI